jgi:hypothetical protein
MNRNFARLTEAGGIEFGPDALAFKDGTVYNPKGVHYRIAGYLPVVETPPSDPPPVGSHWKHSGEYDLSSDGQSVVARYVAEEDPKPTVADYDAAMEAHLVAERCARGYTTREPDMYTGSEVPRWDADARDWKKHRDAVMLYALDIMNRVSAGEPPPTLEEFTSGLPNIVWSYNEE